MLGRRLSVASALRPAVGAACRMLCTAPLPVEPPIALFGTAGRYANALYSAAAKKGALLEVEEDLKLFKDTMAASPVLQNFVVDPSISRTAKSAGIVNLMETAKAAETTKNMMAALAEGGRMGDVFKVIELYDQLMSAAKGELTAIITSAKPLNEAEVTDIMEGLKILLEYDLDEDETIELSKMNTVIKVDEALIGGITVEVGDQFLDLSVATELKQLQTLLADAL